MKLKRWTVSIVAIVFAACGSNQDGTSMESVGMPATGGQASNAMQSPIAGKTASSAGKTGNTGGAPSSGAAGSSDAAAGASASQLVAVAMIMPLMSSTGAAGAAGASSTAGSGAKAGSGGSSGSAGTSNGGSAGKAGSAGGTGSGAGLAVVYGQATFTRLASTDVAVKVEVMGCDNGKSYPVHIHEGTSCDSVMSQGGHWGARKTPEPLPMQLAAGAGGTAGASGTAAAAGGGGSHAGAGGHEAGHAAGSGANAAGSGATTAAAGSGAPTMMLRGEGIPDINCTGTTGSSRGTRDSLDDGLRWTIGTMDESDLLGHVVVIHDGADRIACGKIERKQ